MSLRSLVNLNTYANNTDKTIVFVEKKYTQREIGAEKSAMRKLPVIWKDYMVATFLCLETFLCFLPFDSRLMTGSELNSFSEIPMKHIIIIHAIISRAYTILSM